MTRSTLTPTGQTTIPEEIREQLGISPGDGIDWQIIDGAVQVWPVRPDFLQLRGTVKVGPGSVVEDIHKARRLRGVADG